MCRHSGMCSGRMAFKGDNQHTTVYMKNICYLSFYFKKGIHLINNQNYLTQ